MGSINKSNGIGNKGLEYATSYGTSGLRAHAWSYESLRSDMFFVQYANRVKESESDAIVADAIDSMQQISQYLFRDGNIEFAVHTDSKKFDKVEQ